MLAQIEREGERERADRSCEAVVSSSQSLFVWVQRSEMVPAANDIISPSSLPSARTSCVEKGLTGYLDEIDLYLQPGLVAAELRLQP